MLAASTLRTLSYCHFLQGALRRRMSKVNPIDIDLINVDDDVHTDFSKYTMDQIVKSTKGSFLYAAYTLKKRFEPGEHAIARACLCEDGDPIQEFDIDYANQFLDLTDDGPDLATAYWGGLCILFVLEPLRKNVKLLIE